MTSQADIDAMVKVLIVAWEAVDGCATTQKYKHFSAMAQAVLTIQEAAEYDIEKTIEDATTIQPMVGGWKHQMAAAMVRAFKVGMDTSLQGFEDMLNNDVSGFFGYSERQAMSETIDNIRAQFQVEKGWDRE